MIPGISLRGFRERGIVRDPIETLKGEGTMPDQSPNFTSIKRVNSLGNEYWSARELMPLLGYGNVWHNFEKVMKKAMVACQDLGDPIESHFYPAEKEVKQGRATRKITDYFLSKHACYLIAQN